MSSSSTNSLYGDQFNLKVYTSENFETIVQWMENRFIGLPQFHTSIELKVLKHKRIITKEKDSLKLPYEIKKMTSPNTLEELNSLIANLNGQEGEKSFGLLYLRIKLLPKSLKDLIQSNAIPNGRIVGIMGSSISVPIKLALFSRKSSNYYESIAVGIKGVTDYKSILQVFSEKADESYTVSGGLKVSVEPEDLDHFFLKKIRPFISTGDILNQYLDHYLVPEKKEILKKLCEYTFNGCDMPGKSKHQSIKERKTLVMTT